jgi:uncharacterized protein YlxP (DUF503 family)
MLFIDMLVDSDKCYLQGNSFLYPWVNSLSPKGSFSKKTVGKLQAQNPIFIASIDRQDKGAFSNTFALLIANIYVILELLQKNGGFRSN